MEPARRAPLDRFKGSLSRRVRMGQSQQGQDDERHRVVRASGEVSDRRELSS